MVITDLYLGALAGLLFGLSFGALEIGKRRFGWSPEITRRVAHIVSGGLVLLDYLWLTPLAFVLLVSAGGVLFFAASRARLLTSVNDVRRRTVGQFVLTLGYLGAFAVSMGRTDIFVASVLIITFADALAGLTGDLLASPQRTWWGSTVFFTVTMIILVSMGTPEPLVAIGVAATLTAIERVSPWGLDNVTVPVAAAALLHLSL